MFVSLCCHSRDIATPIVRLFDGMLYKCGQKLLLFVVQILKMAEQHAFIFSYNLKSPECSFVYLIDQLCLRIG